MRSRLTIKAIMNMHDQALITTMMITRTMTMKRMITLTTITPGIRVVAQIGAKSPRACMDMTTVQQLVRGGNPRRAA